MTTLEHATQLVLESMCGLWGHEWGEVEKLGDSPPGGWSIPGRNDVRRSTCGRCNLVVETDAFQRAMYRRELTAAMRPLRHFVDQLDGGKKLIFDKRSH